MTTPRVSLKLTPRQRVLKKYPKAFVYKQSDQLGGAYAAVLKPMAESTHYAETSRGCWRKVARMLCL